MKASPQHPYLPFLEQVLTPTRLAHSLGVMQVMGELAEVYHLDVAKAQTIGILHDAAKDLPQEKIDALMLEGNIQPACECETNYVLYMHGPVGAYFIQKELDVQDEIILEAIKAHTHCGAYAYVLHPMSCCLRFSDLLEPTRNWHREKTILECAARIRELAFSGKMREAVFLQTGGYIQWFAEKGWQIHPMMRRIYQELGMELNLDNGWLRAG